jgi:hypothetical protein
MIRVLVKLFRHAVVQLVESLRYKPEECGFDFRWYHNPSGRTVAL